MYFLPPPSRPSFKGFKLCFVSGLVREQIAVALYMRLALSSLGMPLSSRETRPRWTGYQGESGIFFDIEALTC